MDRVKVSLLKSLTMLAVCIVGGIVPLSFAQVPDLEALERQLEERKEEEARQQARRAAEARRAEEARLRWNQFEKVSDGVLDRGQNVVWAAADNGGDINWPDATAYCRSLGPGWSLPSVSQLQSLYARDTPFSQTVSGYTIYPATSLIRLTSECYWSADTTGTMGPWDVHFSDGTLHSGPHIPDQGCGAVCVRRP